MPSLDSNIFKQLKMDNEYPVFIESGTYNGNTIFNMERHFNKLFTIEIAEHYYNNTKSKYNGNKIKFNLGDSLSVFNTLLPSIDNNTIFFLDGHWSAGDTGKGIKDCPLIEECQIINTLFKHNAILIIDDYRLFGKGPSFNNEVCNWEDISKDSIINTLKDRITDTYHLPSELHNEDRLIVHIKSI